jgi:Lar family restriction alleviation protein
MSEKKLKIEIELKQCPFCGGEDIEINRMYINPFSPDSPPDEVNVGCISCGVGYTEESELEAIEAWNTRAEDKP